MVRFAVKRIVRSLVHRSLAYLAQKSETVHSLLVGEKTTIHFHKAVLPKLTITKPGNLEIFVDPQQLGAEKSVKFFDDDVAGIYTIASGNLIIDKFAVNIDPDESNTTPSDKKHRDTLFRRIGIAENSIHIVNEPQDAQRIITESRFGAELWKQFIIAALVIAIIEMFVSREHTRSLSLGAKQIK
jgi:hypothetical protein